MTFAAVHESLRHEPIVERVLGMVWEELAPGVMGYAHVMADDPSIVYYGVIEAVTEGNGDVGRFLDNLPTDKTHRIALIINPRLEGMVRRRGWTTFYEWFDAAGENVLVYERKATT